VAIDQAIRMAEEVGLDLVEIAPDAQPPVCKVMDFGKYKYEIAQKARLARKNLDTCRGERDEDAPKDRYPRLRDKESSHRTVPSWRRQGQSNDDVPRQGAGSS